MSGLEDSAAPLWPTKPYSPRININSTGAAAFTGVGKRESNPFSASDSVNEFNVGDDRGHASTSTAGASSAAVLSSLSIGANPVVCGASDAPFHNSGNSAAEYCNLPGSLL